MLDSTKIPVFYTFMLFAIMFAFFSPKAEALEIEVKKGRIINLSRPAAHVFIADPTIADIDVRSQNYIYVYGITTGETTLHALDADNRTIISDTITVTPNLGNFEKSIRRLVPQARNLSLESVGNGVIIKGEVDNPRDAENIVNLASNILQDGQSLVNMLEVKGSDQVMLRVRVAEVARSEIKNFGISMQNLFTKGTLSFGLFTGRDFLNAANVLGLSDGNTVRFQAQPGDFSIDGVIDALENEGLVKTLAEPTLTAKSGESASFLAGGEFPIPVPQEGGAVTIEYREFGVSLDFTPTVLSNDKISLQVSPEVSSLTASSVTLNSITVPGLSTRSVSTTVELGSGQSFSIAGLIRNDVSNSIDKFPWLGDMPVLGTLFRSNNFRRDETELVIIVTPYLVRGVDNPDDLLTPTEGYEIPNDFERVFLGKLYNTSERAGRRNNELSEGAIAVRKLNGRPGYILED